MSHGNILIKKIGSFKDYSDFVVGWKQKRFDIETYAQWILLFKIIFHFKFEVIQIKLTF